MKELVSRNVVQLRPKITIIRSNIPLPSFKREIYVRYSILVWFQNGSNPSKSQDIRSGMYSSPLSTPYTHTARQPSSTICSQSTDRKTGGGYIRPSKTNPGLPRSVNPRKTLAICPSRMVAVYCPLQGRLLGEGEGEALKGVSGTSMKSFQPVANRTVSG